MADITCQDCGLGAVRKSKYAMYCLSCCYQHLITYMATRRKRKTAEGYCSMCTARKPPEGRKVCDECRARQDAARKAKHVAPPTEVLLTCEQCKNVVLVKPHGARRFCNPCSDGRNKAASVNTNRRQRAERRKGGLCVLCGEVPRPGGKMCVRHYQSQVRRVKPKMVAEGYCSRCATRKPTDGMKTCTECRAYMRGYYAQGADNASA